MNTILPNNGFDIREYSEPVLSPSYTYKVDLKKNRIAGYVDDDEAIKQAIQLMLLTERGKYEIYPDDYGLQTKDLYGQDPTLVKIRLKSRIEECLMQDLRIEKVEITDMQVVRNELRCRVKCNGHIHVDFSMEI